VINIFRDDPQHWLDRAEKARKHAEQMSDRESKRMMMGIAESYENLGGRAAQRLRTLKNQNDVLRAGAFASRRHSSALRL
jgi:hypothetical protein